MMLNIRRPLLSALCTAILASGSASVAAADGDNSKAVPFTGVVSVSETVVPSQFVDGGTKICPQLSPELYAFIGSITGVGHATHLGKLTLSATDCIQYSSGTEANFKSLPNTVVFFAANGDRLYAAYEGKATYIGGALQLKGTFTFAGGTGRFARASGQGSLIGVEDISATPAGPAIGSFVLSGSISY